MEQVDEKIQKLKTSENIINYIKQSTFNSPDMAYREIKVLNEIIYAVYNESVTSTDLISDFVIRSIYALEENLKTQNKLNKIIEDVEKTENETTETIKKIKRQKLNNILKKNINKKQLYIEELVSILSQKLDIRKVKKLDLTKEDIFYYLFSGFTCIIYNKDIIAVETKATLDRAISTPITENTIKGPKDAFTENYQTNLGLVRKRIKSEKLVLEESKVGRRSKTKVGMLYVSDIVRMGVVDEVKSKLKKIDIDAILDSNYIMEILEDSNKTSFPTMISTERPDLVTLYLLQGRVALVVENSPFILVLPAFMEDFINNMDDYYQKDVDVILTKIIRYIALFITIYTPAIYISLITFNQEAIPTELLLSFVAQRKGVPFPAFFEAMLMIISFEILREGDYRVPNVAGSTLSIVGALILGDAAVSAGIVSPIMIIVVAITTISGLMFSDINMSNSLRSWRFVFLILASLAGLIGVGAGTLLLITKISSTTSFTKPYSYPIAPVNFKSIKNSILKRQNISQNTSRDESCTDNITKYKVKEEC